MALSGVGSPMAFAIAPATAIRPGVAAQARTRLRVLEVSHLNLAHSSKLTWNFKDQYPLYGAFSELQHCFGCG